MRQLGSVMSRRRRKNMSAVPPAIRPTPATTNPPIATPVTGRWPLGGVVVVGGVPGVVLLEPPPSPPPPPPPPPPPGDVVVGGVWVPAQVWVSTNEPFAVCPVTSETPDSKRRPCGVMTTHLRVPLSLVSVPSGLVLNTSAVWSPVLSQPMVTLTRSPGSFGPPPGQLNTQASWVAECVMPAQSD